MIMVDEKTEEPEKEGSEARGALRNRWELRSTVKVNILTEKSKMGIPVGNILSSVMRDFPSAIIEIEIHAMDMSTMFIAEHK